MENDGEGGLKHGPSHQIETLRWIFAQFAAGGSMHWIAKDLNRRGVPSPMDLKWSVEAIRGRLKCRAYRGDFTFGTKPSGQFYQVHGGSTVPASEADTTVNAPIIRAGVYEPLIDPATFDKAQERLAGFGGGKRKPQQKGCLLSGVLICGHCGRPMYGERLPTGRTIYRCATMATTGECGNQRIDEAIIAPSLLEMLGEEITAITTICPDVPAQKPSKAKSSLDEEKEIRRLEKVIDQAEDNLLATTDPRTRQSLDGKIQKLRDQLDQLKAALAEPKDEEQEEVDRETLREWFFDDWYPRAIKVPVAPASLDAAKKANSKFIREAGEIRMEPLARRADGSYRLLVDPHAVRAALATLGCEVRLHWSQTTKTTKGGKTRNSYAFAKGRIRLGQRESFVNNGPP